MVYFRDVCGYIAQINQKFDEEILKKGRFRMETNSATGRLALENMIFPNGLCPNIHPAQKMNCNFRHQTDYKRDSLHSSYRSNGRSAKIPHQNKNLSYPRELKIHYQRQDHRWCGSRLVYLFLK